MPEQKPQIQTLTKSQNLMQTLKFTAVSLSAGAIQALSFTILERQTAWPYSLRYLIALGLSVLFSFTVNRRYTFQSAANVPLAMLQLAAYYAVFTPLSTWGGAQVQALFVAHPVFGEYITNGVSMLLNFVTEFLFSRFVMYRKSVNTNKRGQRENERFHDGK